MRAAAAIALLLLSVAPAAAAGAQPELEPRTATVGDPIAVRLTIDGDGERQPEPVKLGPELGPFHVLEEAWTRDPAAQPPRWTWTATVAAYETGELEFPVLRVPAAGGAAEGWSSEPVAVTIASVLEAGDEEGAGAAEIADLKGPAGLAPDLSPLLLAAILVALFAALSGVAWWLYRRYAARLAAAPAVEDPFARTPPHEWAFAALRELLDHRAEYSADRFYARLAWILKRYLGGRYRLDLLEHTSDEVRPLLEQAGAPATAVTRVAAVLADCDAVKFAKHRPSEAQRKDLVERVYGIIDSTKPAQQPAEPAQGAA